MVHETLKKYTIGDGFDFVADLKNSRGSWFVDKLTGKKYLDCYSCHAAQPLGWNHPKMENYRELMNQVAFHNISNSDLYSEPYAEFVDTFAKITPAFKHYFFIAGGALGVENALKAAFDWKAKSEKYKEDKDMDVIHFQGAFHGRSGYTLSLTNTGHVKTAHYPKFKWTRMLAPYAIFSPAIQGKVLEMIETRLKQGGVAALIMEPIQGEGGDRHFRPSFFQELRKLTMQYDCMFIMDEVQTGLGLTGEMWCHQHFDIVPDMMVFSKKTQVGGFCATDRIDSVPDNVFKVSSRINSTWGGNLADMVRAKAYIDIIQEQQLVKNAAVTGTYFLKKLQGLPLKNVRGRGLMIAFDVENRDEFYNKLMKKIFCLKCGDSSIRFRPHLTFCHDDADFAVNYIKSLC